MSSLLVILSDPISPILEKGEVTERYYNPGNVFSEVHFLLLNDDQPELNSLQYMVGDAKVQIHNYSMPRRLSLKTLGWNRGLLEYFIGDAVGIVRGIDPDVIRTLGLSLDLVVARMAKKELGIPHIASLHTHPHQPPQKLSLINRFFKNGVDRYRAEALKEADEVLPVYKPIISFLESLGVDDYRVCYNVLNSSAINRKKNYEIEELVKVAYVGRQYKDKDPSNLICAVANIEGVYLTLYGDGPFHDRLKSLVKAFQSSGLCPTHPYWCRLV